MHDGWSEEAMRIGMGHRPCWRVWCISGSPLVALKDDVFLAGNLHTKIEELLELPTGIVQHD